jgi:hypothetical protein
VKLVVRDDGTLTGKLALADGKVPAFAMLALGATNPVPASDKDGAFTLTAAAGTHTLTISGPGFVQLRREVTITEGEATDLGTVTLAAGRSIAGRVVDESGAPVAEATVAAGALLTGGGSELYIPSESIGAKRTETDDDGRFVLDGFPPAAITVIAGKDGAGRSASVRIPPSADSATLALVLAPTTSIAGKVTRDGAPLADTIVIAKPIGALDQNFFVTTGPDGTFALDALAPGAYVVSPMLGGGGNRPKDIYVRRVDVELGERAQAEIDATGGSGKLAVHVQGADGAAIAMAQVAVMGAAISPHTAEELRDGSMIPFGPDAIPVYLRGAIGGDVEIEGMRRGTHTACALVGDPIAMACGQVKVGSGKASITLTVAVPK